MEIAKIKNLRSGSDKGIMTKKKILKGAIEKALKNGWNPGYSFKGVRFAEDDEGNPTIHWDKEAKQQQTRDIIFDHRFAKAFWGVGEYPTHFDGGIIKWWQYRLMTMVLEEEPLKYLEQYL